jgi:phosphohistidine phosphatase
MDLILWRHAEAGDNAADIDPEGDLERPLKTKGERQAQRIAEWLNQFLPASTRVLSSPAKRCLQTAEALGRRVKKVDALGPDGTVEGLLAAARWPDSKEPVLVVGHQPVLGMVAAYLMAGEAARFGEPWSIKKGSVWWLRYRPREERGEVVIVAVRTAEGL